MSVALYEDIDIMTTYLFLRGFGRPVVGKRNGPRRVALAECWVAFRLIVVDTEPIIALNCVNL